MKEIDRTIKQYQNAEDDLVMFLASEICRIAPSDADIDAMIEELAGHLKPRYRLPDEAKKMLQDMVEKQRRTQPAPQQRISRGIMPAEFKQIMNSMDKNKNLIGLSDSVMHFNRRHLGLLQRILNLQITQNYLSALKYFILDDFARQQTKFNFTTEKAVNSIIDLIDEVRNENVVSINELMNYRRDSHKWIRRHDLMLDSLEAQIVPEMEIDQKIENMEDRLEIPQLEEQVRIQKEQIQQLEEQVRLQKEQVQQLEEQVQHGEERGEQHRNEMREMDKNLRRMELAVSENYNELKEMIISRDLKTTEFLLKKLAALERRHDKDNA